MPLSSSEERRFAKRNKLKQLKKREKVLKNQFAETEPDPKEVTEGLDRHDTI